MGINRFMHGIEQPVHVTEMSCEMDCCDSHDDCEQEEDSGSDQSCPSGCDCDCCFQITAIRYQFMSVPGATVQSYHFASFRNSYHFEYYTPLIHPPRLA